MANKLAACCLLCLFPLLLIVSLAGFGLSIAEIVIGAKYKDDCPAEKLIPIYLIVMGVFGLVSSGSGVNSARSQRQQGEGAQEEKSTGQKCFAAFSGLVNLFVFIWFICGHVFVFRTEYTPVENSNSTSPLYCNETLYKFAFWSIIARWIVTGAMVALSLCVCCGACCFAICNMRGGGEV